MKRRKWSTINRRTSSVVLCSLLIGRIACQSDPFFTNRSHSSYATRNYVWLSNEAVAFVIREFEKRERAYIQERKKSSHHVSATKHDCRPSSPFITSCGFRSHCKPYICEGLATEIKQFTSKVNQLAVGSKQQKERHATLNCNFNFSSIATPTAKLPLNRHSACIYVSASFFEQFVMEKMPLLLEQVKKTGGRIRVSIFTDKENDQSNPDGQTLASLKMPHKAKLSYILQKFHEMGAFHALHSVNLHWRGNMESKKLFELNSHAAVNVDGGSKNGKSSASSLTSSTTSKPLLVNTKLENTIIAPSRPTWSHCVPIGLANRNPREPSEHPQFYLWAMKRNVMMRKKRDVEKALLFVPLTSFDCTLASKPDRAKACAALTANNFQLLNKKLDKDAYLDMIAQHKFTVAPHGHGLDTHRIMEILLMGGVPVLHSSTLDSCYDDSDNTFSQQEQRVTRGSLPVVFVKKWNDVTRDFLEMEWLRIVKKSPEEWDWKRLFIDHWLERIDS